MAPAATSKPADLTFFLAVTPRPASRPRFACRGRFAQAYMDGPYRAWQEAAQAELAKYRPFNSEEPYTGDIEIVVTVLVRKPKSTVKVRPSGDIDNYAKGVYDAVTQTKGFWADDDQIVAAGLYKRWANEWEEPGYQIIVRFK